MKINFLKRKMYSVIILFIICNIFIVSSVFATEAIIKNEEVKMIDTFIDLGDAPRLAYLGRSIQLMADADLVLFMPGWNGADGCLVEHLTAIRYGIRTMYFIEEDKYGWIF